MSVTIGKLVADYNSATFEERQRTKDIEVIPRKVVEDIISACEAYQNTILSSNYREDISAKPSDVAADNGRIAALGFSMKVASQYLEEFEEGVEE